MIDYSLLNLALVLTLGRPTHSLEKTQPYQFTTFATINKSLEWEQF